MTIASNGDNAGSRRPTRALRHERVALGAGIVAASLLVGSGAQAQTKAELDQARGWFQEGMALSAANDCAGAIVKYRAVAQVKLTAQVSFNLAECEARLGKLVSALGDYRLAASAAADDKKSKQVAALVPDRIEALEARIPKLTITRGKGADTAKIELDGNELGSNELTDHPVDPGVHLIVAKVGEKEYVHEKLTLDEKDVKTFEVKFRMAAAVVETEPEPKTEEPVAPPTPARSKAPGIIALSVGAASLVVGGVFLGLRAGQISQLDTLCGGGTSCPKSAQPIADAGRTYTGVAEATVLIGAVGVGVGIFLLVKASSGSAKPASAFLGATPVSKTKPGFELVATAPGASLGGASLLGRF